MRFNDAIPGAIFLAIAVLAFLHAGTFTTFPGVPYGPDLFPRIIAVMMGSGGLILIWSGLLVGERRPWLELEPWARNWRSYGMFATVVGAVLFYVFASDTLGFILTGWLMLTGLYAVTRGARSILSSAVISACVIAAIHMLFAEALRVPLPFGVIERLLVS